MTTQLSWTERSYLYQPTRLNRFLSVVPFTGSIQATARIAQATFLYPIKQFTVDTTSADWSAVEAGQTAIISHQANGVDPVWIGRLNYAPGATTLFINEISEADIGMIPRAYTIARFLDNMYVTILHRFDIHSVFPKLNYPTTGLIAEDSDFFYSSSGEFNRYPGPVVRITIDGYPGHHNCFIDSGQTYATLVLTAFEDLWITSASISGRLWTIPSSWTVVGGSLTSNTVTVRAPLNGIDPYHIRYRATENHGSITYARRLVWVYEPYGSMAPLVMPVDQIGSDSRDRSGRRMTFNLMGQGLMQIPDGSMVVYWETPFFGSNDIVSATRQFCGWVLAHTEVTDFGYCDTAVEVVGPMGLLRRSEGQFFELASVPSTWQQLESALAYIDFILYWIARRRAGNLTELFDYNRMNISNLSGRRAQWRINPGKLAAQLQQTAAKYQANFGCDSTGAVWVRRHPSLLPTILRNNLNVIRTNLDHRMLRRVTVRRNLQNQVGWVRGDGFMSDGFTDTPLKAIWPGVTSGQGAGEKSVSDLCVDSQGELNVLLSNLAALDNNPTPSVNVLIEKNLDIFEPAKMESYTMGLASAERSDGATWPDVGNSESHLTDAMDDSQTTIPSYLSNLQLGMILKVDDEYMLIIDTASAPDYDVERGYLNSTPAAHLLNTQIYRTISFIPKSVSKAHNIKHGVADLTVDFEGETAGFTSSTVFIPPVKPDLYETYEPPIVPPVETPAVEDGSVPKTVFVLARTGRFIRGGWNGTRFVWQEISATAAQRTAVGCAASGNNLAVKFIFDPFKLNRVIVLCTTGLLICDDVMATTPSWTTVTGFLPSGVTSLCYEPGFAGYRGDIVASNLVPGMFLWTYLPSTGAGTGVQRTLNNFSTFSNTTLDTTDTGGGATLKISSLTLSSHNPNNVWCGTGLDIYESVNKGQSFSLASYPHDSLATGADRRWMGPVNMPYSLPGGAPNTSDADLASVLYKYSSGQAWYISGSRTFLVPGGVEFRSADPYHSFTLDGNYLARASTTAVLRTTIDGGASYQNKTNPPSNPGSGHTGLNGWPGNHNYLLAYGKGQIAYTLDLADTWANLRPDLDADLVAVGDPGAFTESISYAAGYLGDRFPVDGVHPS